MPTTSKAGSKSKKAKPARKPAPVKANGKKVARPAAAPRKVIEEERTDRVRRTEAPRPARDVTHSDPGLFEPLTAGERADALRILLEDKRVAAMAKVGRYRVVAVDPLVVKPPEPLAGKRLARIVIYDYAADVCVDACIDLDRSMVCYVSMSTTQPMLAPEEEAAAIAIAMSDDRVKAQLSLGDEPLVAMQYWSRHNSDLAFRRRSAAVLFGAPGARPTAVAVVDLVDNVVADVVPAEQW